MSAEDVVLYGTASVIGLFWVVVFGYTFFSYAVARSFVAPRPLRALVSHATWEALLALVVQPLLPLFFVVGRRMGGRSKGQPVVFVHGYFQNRVDFLYLARILSSAGLGPFYGFNYWSFGRIERSADRLARFVERVCAEQGATQVDLVCHSLGGLVAAEYARSHPARVRRCVTIASPHAGIAWPGPVLGPSGAQMRPNGRYLTERARLPWVVPLLSIYSSHDNVVYPPATSARAQVGGRDLLIDGPGHFAILFDRRTAEATRAFLSEPPEGALS